MRDAYCLSCGGYTGVSGKRGADITQYRCARSEVGVFSCLGRLTGNKMLAPPDKGWKRRIDGTPIIVLTTAPESALRAAQREWTVPVGRCAP